MVLNDEICVQRKIPERTRLLSISNSIREDIGSYNKKENEKENITTH